MIYHTNRTTPLYVSPKLWNALSLPVDSLFHCLVSDNKSSFLSFVFTDYPGSYCSMVMLAQHLYLKQ